MPSSAGSRADEGAALLPTIPGVGWLLELTFAAEIGDIARFSSARKLVGYPGLVPKVRPSGQSARTGSLSKAGSPLLRWAAVRPPSTPGGRRNPWHRLYTSAPAKGTETRRSPPSLARS